MLPKREEEFMTEKRLPAGTGAAHFEKAGGESGEATPSELAPGPRITQVRPPRYDFHAFESKWRARWEEQKLYQVDLHGARRPYYNLMMFPYPSAEGLHVGNLYSYIGS